MPLLISKKAAAFSLGISVGMLDKLVRQGMIGTVRIGRRVLFGKDALDDFIRTNQLRRPPIVLETIGSVN